MQYVVCSFLYVILREAECRQWDFFLGLQVIRSAGPRSVRATTKGVTGVGDIPSVSILSFFADPPGMGPDSRSWLLELPNWVLDSLRGLRVSAESWVQELKTSSPAGFLLVVEAGGRDPGRSLDLTIQRLTVA